MSLSFSPITDICGNNVSLLLYNDTDNMTDNITNNPSSLNESDLLSLYNVEIEKRKMELKCIDKVEKDNLTEPDLNFLSNVISIKNKILFMKKEYKSLLEKSKSIQKDMESIEEVKSVYDKFSQIYLSTLNKEGNKEIMMNIMMDILNSIESKKIQKEEVDKKLYDILMNITNLKNMIRIDNLDDKIETPVLETEINPALLCFTCNEKQITHCFNPCGHSFCEDCVSRVNINSFNAICFMCRANVNGIIKIYFS